jgi:hypothetical protein
MSTFLLETQNVFFSPHNLLVCNRTSIQLSPKYLPEKWILFSFFHRVACNHEKVHQRKKSMCVDLKI